MFRLIILMLFVPLLFGTFGCATHHPPQQKPFAGFPFRHNGFDFKQAWKASPSPQGLTVEGALKNVRYFRVETLELTVSMLRNGEKVTRDERYFFSGGINKDEYRDFRLLLKDVTAVPGDLLQFAIRYNALDGTNNFGWTSDFTADVFTGVALQKPEEISSEE